MFGTDKISPEVLLGLGNLARGNNWGEQVANAGTGVLTAVNAQKDKAASQDVVNKTVSALQVEAPDLAMAVKNGSLTATDGYRQYLDRKAKAAENARPEYQFQELPDGTYGNWDKRTGKFDRLGTYQKPVEPTAIQRDLEAAGLRPGTPEYQRAILDNYNKSGGQDDYANRAAMAEKLGLPKDDPRYQSFVLTGKMPREDAQALTAVDKKAILEADEMVAVNAQAIDALKSAKQLSDQANSGWLASTRANLGANLPDWLVPDDYVSSPESSNATINYDNAVIGQALGQLKAIFGGAPTEGERKILLDLQGSSNMPATARKEILDRAIAAAERRLQFNQERANDLRGGEYYKPNRSNTQQPANNGKTTGGLNWSVEQ